MPGSSTVTFLFSDIEGSTRLEQQVGTTRYGEIRERHRAILRAAFEQHEGREQGTEGDSFFVIFDSARDALAAAACRASAPWPRSRGRRASWSGSGWASTPASRSRPAAASWAWTSTGRRASRASPTAARSLVSAATRALVGTALPDGATWRDLGEHRLRDIEDTGAAVAGAHRRSARRLPAHSGRRRRPWATCRRA